MATTLMPNLELSSIERHPKNPRHRAVADDDMVSSIKTQGLIQPIVVAPHPDHAGKYVLIAGHRRVDGSRKAKRKTVPAILRTDLVTEGQQIEAMIIENGHRADLSPIEEAEGYAQLELLGYKAPGIATAVGRDVKTVRGRLKLLKLAASTKKKVHDGQLTIEDANAFVEFADDPDATKALETAARGSDWEWKSTLKRQRRVREVNKKIAVDVAKLLDAGATEVDHQGKNSWQLWNYNLGPTPLTRTHSTDWGQHQGCLGFVHFPGTGYSDPSLDVCCTKPSNHTDQLDQAEREAIATAEQEAKDEAEKAEQERVAREIRLEHVVSLAEAETLPASTADIVRLFIRYHIGELHDEALVAYQHLVGVPESDRWEWVGGHDTRASRNVDRTLLAQHLATFDGLSAARLNRALVACLIVAAEKNISESWRRNNHAALSYFEFLQASGHKLGRTDKAQRAEFANHIVAAGANAKNSEAS